VPIPVPVPVPKPVMNVNVSSPTTATATPVSVEIYPGIWEQVRGAKETTQAQRNNYLVACTCVVCTIDYSCINDAAYVICPLCRVVNPLSFSYNNDNTIKSGYNGINSINNINHHHGVGLGFITGDEGQ